MGQRDNLIELFSQSHKSWGRKYNYETIHDDNKDNFQQRFPKILPQHFCHLIKQKILSSRSDAAAMAIYEDERCLKMLQ